MDKLKAAAESARQALLLFVGPAGKGASILQHAARLGVTLGAIMIVVGFAFIIFIDRKSDQPETGLLILAGVVAVTSYVVAGVRHPYIFGMLVLALSLSLSYWYISTGMVASTEKSNDEESDGEKATVTLRYGGFGTKKCDDPDRPLALIIDNKSSKRLTKISWRLAVYQPRHSSTLATEFMDSDIVLRPGQRVGKCSPLPAAIKGWPTQKDLDFLKAHPEADAKFRARFGYGKSDLDFLSAHPEAAEKFKAKFGHLPGVPDDLTAAAGDASKLIYTTDLITREFDQSVPEAVEHITPKEVQPSTPPIAASKDSPRGDSR